MSNRGSFVTEYIYCDKCFQAAKTVLLQKNKQICSVVVPHWNPEREGPEMPIIAGKVGNTLNVVFVITDEIQPMLEKVICHPLRIAVFEDCDPDDPRSAVSILVAPTAWGAE